MDITPTLKRMTAGALLAGGLAVSGLGHTGSYRSRGRYFRAAPLVPGATNRSAHRSGPGGLGLARLPHVLLHQLWDGQSRSFLRRRKGFRMGRGQPTPAAGSDHPTDIARQSHSCARKASRIRGLGRLVVTWPVRARPHSDAGTADIRQYLGRCQRRSCSHELARGEANCKSRFPPRPTVRPT